MTSNVILVSIHNSSLFPWLKCTAHSRTWPKSLVNCISTTYSNLYQAITLKKTAFYTTYLHHLQRRNLRDRHAIPYSSSFILQSLLLILLSIQLSSKLLSPKLHLYFSLSRLYSSFILSSFIYSF